jgi:DNA-directed RNA polymerase subunit H (RpoH/RPB5)
MNRWPAESATAHVEVGSLPLFSKTTNAWTSALFCVRIVARATYPAPSPDGESERANGDGGDGGEAGGNGVGDGKSGGAEDSKAGGGDGDVKADDSKAGGDGDGGDPETDVGDNDRLRMVVVLHDRDNGPLGVQNIRMYFTWLAEKHISRVIFLLERPLTPQAMSEANRLVAGMEWNLECEFFLFSELPFIAVDHCDVPLHETVPPRQVRALLNDVLRVEAQHLPRLRLSLDPVAKYYGNRAGDIARITSPSFTAGSRVSYCRIVP